MCKQRETPNIMLGQIQTQDFLRMLSENIPGM